MAFSSLTMEPVGTALFSSIFCQTTPTGLELPVEMLLTTVILVTMYWRNTAAHLLNVFKRVYGSKVVEEAIPPADIELLKYGETNTIW